MKGAIGNAFILNMVIGFILIFYILLIGSIAFSKAYKVKNFLLNDTVQFDEVARNSIVKKEGFEENFFGRMYAAWDFEYTEDVNALTKFGYQLRGYDCSRGVEMNVRSVYSGSNYDYCIDLIEEETNVDELVQFKYRYRVRTYMKFDFPIIGQFIRIPITGETKTITVFK